MSRIKCWFFEHFRIFFSLFCLGGLGQAFSICWDTCRMLGYDLPELTLF